MPDLTLTFTNPRLLDDVSFHPCVRFKKWEVYCAYFPPLSSHYSLLCFRMIVFYHLYHLMVTFVLYPIILVHKSLSFFFLIKVLLSILSLSISSIGVPIYLKHNIQFREGSAGRFEVTIGPKQTMGKTVCFKN
jgi:AP-3 complex subunit mu